MTIIDRVRSVVAQRVGPALAQPLSAALPAGLGAQLAGAVSRAGSGGPQQATAPGAPVVADIMRLAAGGGSPQAEAARRLRAATAGVDAALRRQVEGLLPSGAPLGAGGGLSALPGMPPVVGPVAASPILPPPSWPAAPLFGGLTLDRYRQLFLEGAQVQRSWKNLFHVSVRELKTSKECPSGPGPLNLLAVDVGFAPCTMPGDMIPVGAANVDSLMQTERVELRMTTLDDWRGSLARWFVAKCDQAAHTDGSFGLPVEYLVEVTVTEMATVDDADQDKRLRHRWLMRPANIEVELSRRANELKELQMSFVQFDTFMVTA